MQNNLKDNLLRLKAGYVSIKKKMFSYWKIQKQLKKKFEKSD